MDIKKIDDKTLEVTTKSYIFKENLLSGKAII